jgi:hypothetical protein
LVEKPEGKRPLGRRWSRWNDNIITGLRNNRLVSYGLDSYGSGWRPVAGSCEYGNEPLGTLKGGRFPDCMSDLASREGLCPTELYS